MERHLDVKLSDLKEKLLLMGRAVESQLQDVWHALTERNSDLAIRVVENDLHINKKEGGIRAVRLEVTENSEESYGGLVADQEGVIQRGDDGGRLLQRGDSREGHVG